jgi:pimeloyl-ACP methyl ester carboxylesterase
VQSLDLLQKLSHGVLRASGARSAVVPTDVGRVHAYDIRGRGAGTFVLLHGLGVSATAYTAVARLLRRDARRILLVDLPGHGRSSAPSLDVPTLSSGLEQGLDALLAGDRVVLLGTSLGGAAALGYALARPERVESLVLVSPAGAPLSEEEIAELRARFDLRTRADARRFYAELLHAPPWYMRLLERGLVAQLGRPTVQAFLGNVGAADTFTAERLAGLAPPTTVLWGKSDRILPRSALSFYRQALPGHARFVELDAVGHSPHFERPGLVAEHLLAARADRREREPGPAQR